MRDSLLVVLEVAFVVLGVAGVWILVGAAAAMIVAAIIGVVAVEVRGR